MLAFFKHQSCKVKYTCTYSVELVVVVVVVVVVVFN